MEGMLSRSSTSASTSTLSASAVQQLVPIPPSFPASAPYAACYCEENSYQLVELLQTELQLPDYRYPSTQPLTRKGKEVSVRNEQSWQTYVIFVSNKDKSVLLWQQKASNSPDKGHPVLWDYHVIVVLTCRSTTTIARETQRKRTRSLFRVSSSASMSRRRLPSNSSSGDPSPVDSPEPSSAPSQQTSTSWHAWVYDADSMLSGAVPTRKAVSASAAPDAASTSLARLQPIEWDAYIKGTFRPELIGTPKVHPNFLPTFRIVPGSDFVARFASDRSHMLVLGGDGSTLQYSVQPPPWQAIAGPTARDEGTLMNLEERYLDMSTSNPVNGYGWIVNFDQLLQHGLEALCQPEEQVVDNPIESIPQAISDSEHIDTNAHNRTDSVATNASEIASLAFPAVPSRPERNPSRAASIMASSTTHHRMPPAPPGANSQGGAKGGARGGRVSSPLFPAYLAASLAARSTRARGSYVGLHPTAAELADAGGGGLSA